MKRTAVALIVMAALLSACGDRPDTLVTSAKDYRAKSDYSAAVIQLRNALQQAPNNGEARYLLGDSLLQTRDPVTAEKELRKALELGYSPDEVVPRLARAMMDIGQGDKMIAEFNQRTLSDPVAQAKLRVLIGDQLLAQGKLPEAKAAYAAALQAHPGDIAARVGEARVVAATEGIEQSVPLADAILKQAPDSVEALTLRGQLYGAQNDLAAAERSYLKVIELQPGDIGARRTLISAYIASNQLDKASAQIEAARKAGMNNDVLLTYLDALLHLRQRDFAKARDLSQQVLRVLPAHGPSLFVSGAANYYLNSLPQAEDALRKVLEAAPRHDGARRMLVATYLREGQAARAAETLQPLLDRPQISSDVLALAGEVAMANGDNTRATDYFERAAKLDAGNADVRSRLAQLHFSAGDATQGLEDLEAASAADPNKVQADVLLVLSHLRRKEYDRALAAAATLQKKQPNNPLAFNVKGAVLLAKKDNAGARASFQQALKLQPDYSPALVNLARLDLHEKDLPAARKDFDEALQKSPNNEQLLLSYAQFLAEQNAPHAEVQTLLERAIRANSASAPARIALINLKAQSGDSKGALSTAQEALAALPNNPGVLDAGGRAQLAAGETNQALDTFNKLVERLPQSPTPWVRVAQAQMAAKRPDQAIDALRKAIALRPDFAAAYADIVNIQVASGHLDQAMTEARNLQKQKPNEALGYALEGDVHVAQKKWDEAEAAYRQGLQRQADDSTLFVKLHRVLSLAQRQPEADSLAAKWVKDHPKDLNAQVYLAENALAQKHYKEAAAHYRTVTEAQPANVLALNNLAWVLGQSGDAAGALQYAQKAYDLAPNNAAVLDTFGMLLVNKGDATRGLPMLEQAVKLAPQADAIRLNHAKALVKTGNKDQARREFQELSKASDNQIKTEAEAALKSL